jgi:serine/threonine protein kinase
MILEYAKNGSLRTCLNTNYNKFGWYNKIKNLYDIVSGLKSIHQNGLIHRDLHAGNILMNENRMFISDMGLCRPASENIKNNVYGVLCYMAPETLQKHNYTKTSDIYSFGIIMYEVICGLPSYHDVCFGNKNLPRT